MDEVFKLAGFNVSPTIHQDDTEIGQDIIAALGASIDAVVLRNREIEFQRRTLLQLAIFSLDNSFRSLTEHVFRTHIFVVRLPSPGAAELGPSPVPGSAAWRCC